MTVLKISLLGPFTAAYIDFPRINIPAQKAQALLIYLSVERGTPHRREQLFTLLWPGMPEKSARHNLSQVLYTLRQVFPFLKDKNGEQIPLLLADRQTIQLHPEVEVEIDVERLEAVVKRVKSHDHARLVECERCIQALGQIVDEYRGDFLTDFYLEDSNLFEDWAVAIRGRCQEQILFVLSTLVDLNLQKQNYEEALGYIKRQLAIDNLREEAHRQLMEVLTLHGRRVEALQHYREYVQMLETELGVTTSKSISELYERIRREGLLQRPPKQVVDVPKTAPPRHNLIPQLTPFIGREKELAELDAMLADEDIRLITITGSGGMGKTRLAIACAERQLGGRVLSVRKGKSEDRHYTFPDGVFFFPLADIDNTEQLPHEIAKGLSLTLHPGGIGPHEDLTIKMQLLGYLQPKQILLVLDNFEQLAEGVEFLMEILQVAPKLKLLVTSRERLHLRAEQVFPVEGLDFPDGVVPGDSREFTAIQLFMEIAQRVRPDFELMLGEEVPLTQICCLLGGMPLGLELAASWVDILPISQIQMEIQKEIDFLESDVRDFPERHRSLQAVCASTWNRLSETEQTTFTSLSIFLGGFTREAAQEVCAASIRTLADLQNKSLVQYDPGNERYQIHPYLRQYGLKRLEETPKDRHDLLDRYCAYFCSFVEKFTKVDFIGLTVVDFNQNEINKINFEITNILAAWDWVLEHEQVYSVEQVLDGLYQYFNWNYQYQAILSICQQANEMLIRVELLSGSAQEPSIDRVRQVRAKVLIYLGHLIFPFDNNQATLFFEQSMQILRDLSLAGLDTRIEKAQLLRFQADRVNDYDSAKLLLAESIRLSKEKNDLGGIFESIFVNGYKALLSGLLQEAKDWAEQGLGLAQLHKSYCWAVYFQLILGRVTRRLRNYRESIHYYQNTISKAVTVGNNCHLQNSYQEFSWLMLFLGHLEEAKTLSTASIEMGVKLGLTSHYYSFLTLGVIQWLSGLFDEAEKSIMTSFGNKQDWNHWLCIVGDIFQIEFLVLMGNYWEAKDKANNKELWLDGFDYKSIPAFNSFLRSLGIIALVERDHELAKIHLIESIKVLLDNQEYYEEWSAWSQAYLALVEINLGNISQAKEIITEALSTALHIQGYIPMVFNLPMTLLILANDNLELGAEVYQQVMSDPFTGRAPLFEDLVYQYLPDEIRSIPVNPVENSPKHRERLWAMARKVLGVLK